MPDVCHPETVHDIAAYFSCSTTPLLDALILTEWASGLQRAYILQELHTPIHMLMDSRNIQNLLHAVQARSRGKPIAHIVQRKEFFGMDFLVDDSVLVPRPDTETLVEAAVQYLQTIPPNTSVRIHDCCTGCGCVGLALAYEAEKLQYMPRLSLSDIAEKPLSCAQKNAQLLQIPTECQRGDLLETLTEKADIITANPPYLTKEEAEKLPWEPQTALFGGKDGMYYLRKLLQQALPVLHTRGCIFLECAPSHIPILQEYAADLQYAFTEVFSDLHGAPRVLAAGMSAC